MIKREDIKKMLVSEGGDKWLERYVLYQNENNSCIAVDLKDEKEFLSGDLFKTSWWKFCKPIPEKKKRPMNRNEFLKFILKNHDKILARMITDDNRLLWSFATNIYIENNLSKYEYIFIDELGTDHETPKKFEIECEEGE